MPLARCLDPNVSLTLREVGMWAGDAYAWRVGGDTYVGREAGGYDEATRTRTTKGQCGCADSAKKEER